MLTIEERDYPSYTGMRTNFLFNGCTVQETQLVNLTPHPIVILIGQDRLTIPVGGDPARLQARKTDSNTIFWNGTAITVYEQVHEEPVGLPRPQRGITLIVSRVVAERYPLRDDLVFPSDLERDFRSGEVIACRSLSRLGT